MGKRTTMKTLGIFACLLAVVFAAENAVADDKTVQVAESVDQLSEELRYGGYRGGYRGGYGGGRRYGRSIADEAQELEVQEQSYGGYRGDTAVDMVAVADMVAPLLMKLKNSKYKSKATVDTVVDTAVDMVAVADMVAPSLPKFPF